MSQAFCHGGKSRFLKRVLASPFWPILTEVTLKDGPDFVRGGGTVHRLMKRDCSFCVSLDVIDVYDVVGLPGHDSRLSADLSGREVIVLSGTENAALDVVSAAIRLAVRVCPTAELHIVP